MKERQGAVREKEEEKGGLAKGDRERKGGREAERDFPGIPSRIRVMFGLSC